jgi:hypothetical protein
VKLQIKKERSEAARLQIRAFGLFFFLIDNAFLLTAAPTLQ